LHSIHLDIKISRIRFDGNNFDINFAEVAAIFDITFAGVIADFDENFAES